MTEPVLIIGSGALACLFAARLTRSGQPVTLTGTWESGMDAIRNNGIGLIEMDKKSIIPVATLDETAVKSRFTAAILLTKAHQTRTALQRIEPWLSADGSVLSLQNGLTPRGQMLSVLGEQRAISGITLCAVELIEPGIVRHNGGKAVYLGQHPAAVYYQDILTRADFSVTVANDIQRMIWEKAVINSAANPLGAIMRYTNGEMSNQPDLMDVMDELIREACKVARAEGILVDPQELLARVRQIMKDSAGNRCSMLQDVLNGRKTEIEDINGVIIDLARKHGIATPVHETVARMVRSISKKE